MSKVAEMLEDDALDTKADGVKCNNGLGKSILGEGERV